MLGSLAMAFFVAALMRSTYKELLLRKAIKRLRMEADFLRATNRELKQAVVLGTYCYHVPRQHTHHYDTHIKAEILPHSIRIYCACGDAIAVPGGRFDA